MDIGKLFRIAVTSFLLICCTAALSAQGYSAVPSAIADSVEVREKVAGDWFIESIASMRKLEPLILETSKGVSFRVSREETTLYTAVAVAPRAADGTYPVNGRGSWILYRDRNSGEPVRIRLYPGDSPEIYLQFFPGGRNSRAELYLYGAYPGRNVPLGVSFEKLYTLSSAELLRLVRRDLLRKYAEPNPLDYDNTRKTITLIRENLSRFEYVEDAAYDENGRAVNIADGILPVPPQTADTESGKLDVNCSGFVKWIVDGIIKPLTGSFLKISPLKTATVTGTNWLEGWEEKREPWFGLDWTRNLAAAAVSAYTGRNTLYPQSGVDVTSDFFAAVTTVNSAGERSLITDAGYVRNNGYDMRILKPLLYMLAVTEPDRFYLGAVRSLYDGKKR
ncbi:MAG: hypothetical protein LBR47_03305, partial [Spirochaetaceae bacterium]|nr:hypothetical protein [Spirochaetaceae bacterium]